MCTEDAIIKHFSPVKDFKLDCRKGHSALPEFDTMAELNLQKSLKD